jgi:hypothetical protein
VHDTVQDLILSCGSKFNRHLIYNDVHDDPELWVQYPFWFKKTGPEPGFRFILGAKTALAVGFIAKSRK